MPPQKRTNNTRYYQQKQSIEHYQRIELTVRQLMAINPSISLRGLSAKMNNTWGGAISRAYNKVRRERSEKV